MRSNTWFIAGKSPIQVSQLHRLVWVDERSGKVVCGPQPGARQQVVEQWGSDMQRLFRQAGLPRADMNDAACDAASTSSENAPLISSPLRGVRHQIRTSKPEPLVLRAEAAAGSQSIYWFANDSLVGRTAPGEGITWMPPLAETGQRHVLRAIDDQGRAESREVIVDVLP